MDQSPVQPNPVEPNPVEPNPVEPSVVEPSVVEPSVVERTPTEDPARSDDGLPTMRDEEAHPRRGSWTAAVPGWSAPDDDLRIEPEQPHPLREFSSEESRASAPPPSADDADDVAPIGLSVRMMLLCLGGGVLLAAVLSVLAVVPI